MQTLIIPKKIVNQKQLEKYVGTTRAIGLKHKDVRERAVLR